MTVMRTLKLSKGLCGISVLVMEIIAGVGYLFTASTITTAKLDITVTDFAQ